MPFVPDTFNFLKFSENVVLISSDAPFCRSNNCYRKIYNYLMQTG